MTDTRPRDARPGWWPRWRGTLLVASLALNLLVAGIVGAAAIRHRLAPPPGPVAQANVFGFARELAVPRRRQIWAATQSERQALRPFRQELRTARGEVNAALAAEPFDAARFKAAHERLLKAEIGARTAAHSLFEAMVMQLSPAERQAFARWQPPPQGDWRRRPGGWFGKSAGRPGRDGAEPADGTPAPGAAPAVAAQPQPEPPPPAAPAKP